MTDNKRPGGPARGEFGRPAEAIIRETEHADEGVRGLEPAAAVADLVAGNNRFAADLYAQLQLRARPGNLAFSPFSVSAALAMIHAGARGETAAQLARAAHFGDPAGLHPAFRALLDRIADPDSIKPYLLAVASALWAQRDTVLLAEFAATLWRHYFVQIHRADFRHEAEYARTMINRHVEEHTAGKIRDLLREPPAPDTSLILVNAVYFKGAWAEPFEEVDTRTEDFFPTRDAPVPARFMHRTGRYAYRHFQGSAGFKFLKLPYAGAELSMVLLLPDAPDGLPALEGLLLADGLSGRHLRDFPAAGERPEVDVALPRFRVESRFSLRAALEQLGMVAAFSPGMADFSGIGGSRDLHVSAVVHQAFVETNEAGTEAAAASAAVLERTCGGFGLPREQFRADHPFLFLIVDDRSGSVLFLGRVAEPAAP